MAPKARQQPAPVARPVDQRGKEWQAEKLTGARAQRGTLPNGQPRWTYEVQWVGAQNKNTFEPAECLIGWEAQMRLVDERSLQLAALPAIRVAAAAKQKAEAEAKQRAERLQDQRQRLDRQRRRRARQHRVDDGDDDDDDDGGGDAEEEADEDGLPLQGDAEIVEELARIDRELASMAQAQRAAAAAAAQAQRSDEPRQGCDDGGDRDAAAEDAGDDQAAAAERGSGGKRAPRSRVWMAFDRLTNKCILPHPTKAGQQCGALGGRGTGTSGKRQHLERVHPAEWQHILMTGERKSTAQTISEAMASIVDISKPPLPQSLGNELDRLAARWIARCGRPQIIVDDKELNELIAHILNKCQV